MNRHRLLTIGLALLATALVVRPLCAQFSAMNSPSTWRANGNPVIGGGFGNNLSLIANQTAPVHRQIGNMLGQLRRAQGPMVNVSTPFNTVQDSFFERMGVGFNFSIPGGRNVVGLDTQGNRTPDGRIRFTQGGFNSAIPPFGDFDPGSVARVGFGVRGGGLNFDLLGAFGQGSTRTHTSQVPSVTVFNGVPGTVSDTVQRPFVTGLVPVVNGLPSGMFAVPPTTYSPLRDKIRSYFNKQSRRGSGVAASTTGAGPSYRNLTPSEKLAVKMSATQNSSAVQGDLSVAEIKRQKAQRDSAEAEVKQREILAMIERGRGAEEAGKPGVAKIHYRQAARRANGELRRELIEKIQSLSKE